MSVWHYKEYHMYLMFLWLKVQEYASEQARLAFG